MNNFTLSGHLGADPELRHTRRGSQPYVRLRVANSRPFNGRQKTAWFTFTCFRNAERIAEDLHTGSKIVLQGSLGSSIWAAPNGGDKRYYIDLVVDEVVYFTNGSGNGATESQPAEADGEPTDAEAK